MKKNLLVIASIVAIVVICSIVFVACAPSSYDKAVEKMEDAGYTVIGSTYSATDSGAVATLTATNATIQSSLNGTAKTVVAVLYESSKQAKAAAADNEDAVVSGKWVLAGDAEAIKAFKK